MARLPAPVVTEMDAIWPEDWAIREKSFFSILGQAIRKANTVENNSQKGDIKDKPD